MSWVVEGDGENYVGGDYVNKYMVGGSVIAVFVGVGVVLYYLKNNKSNLYPETKNGANKANRKSNKFTMD